jgi:phosphoribosylformylglycinamidine cyclo-ligase
LFEKLKLKLSSRIPGVRGTVGDELLRVHKNYQPLLTRIPLGTIRGLAHITGGGLIDNVPRVLPKHCDAIIDTRNWRVPEIFKFIGRNGNIDREEMYQVFNMGIGMVTIVAERDAKRTMSTLHAKRIGKIERGSGKTRLIFNGG